MKKHSILAFLLALATAIGVTSCSLSSDYNTEVSRDCAISAVTIGTLNRSIYTKNTSGKDTIIASTVTGSNYPMYIDQLNNHIYNADSLPLGTDVSKVVFDTFSYSSYVLIRKLNSTEDTLYQAKDSTDFTQPRIFTITAADGVSKRQYTIDVRAHKQEADSCTWQTIANGTATQLNNLQKMHAVTDGSNIYLYGQNAQGTTCVAQGNSSTPAFDNFSDLATINGKNIEPQTIRYFNNHFYALTAGQLVSSTNGITDWQSTEVAIKFTALAGHSTDSLYAVANKQMYATADGINWSQSTVDDDSSLPSTNVDAVCLPSHSDDTYECMVMTGQNADGVSVWKRDIDLTGDFSYPWINLPQTSDLGKYFCPTLNSAALHAYDGAALLVGVTSEGYMSPIYLSRDYGRSWKIGEMRHDSIGSVTALASVVDQHNFLWLFCAGNASIYKVRINRLGWATEATRFEKVGPKL